MAILLSKYLSYEKNDRLFVLSLLFSAATFVVYMVYFDILVPFIPQGSVRYNSDGFFAIPVFLLISAQTLFVTYFLHATIKAIDQKKRDLLKAYFVSSVEIFLFSLLYVFFPYYGPYTYVVYFMPGENFPLLSYPLLVFWTMITILATSLMIEREFHLVQNRHIGPKRLFILGATMLAAIIAMAS
ncbi:MAG: hypothetical protein ACRECH_01335 [Nitrososphaerales archaeon]